MLDNIEALENIAPESIVDLHIIDNPLLSQCHISNICQYLLAPAGTVEIYNNADGCNSPDEVEQACDTTTAIPEYRTKTEFSISPNPLETSALVKYTLHQSSHVILQILDLNGREIFSIENEEQITGNYKIVIDGASLKPGVYFCVLKTNKRNQTMKMIKL